MEQPLKQQRWIKQTFLFYFNLKVFGNGKFFQERMQEMASKSVSKT